MSRRVIVAIDGPAGAGKSTLAAHLAKRFGLLNLETGAMYRALALKSATLHLNPDDAAAITSLTESTTIALEPADAGNRVVLDGEDVTSRLRVPEITLLASRVSVHPGVRHWMVDLQRSMAARDSVVMEGRDIGTEVFPEAEVKIFLDASAEARSERRFEQNPQTAASREATLREIRERDDRDRNRTESPLRPAADAVVLDTTSMTLEQVMQRAEDLVSARL